MNWHHLVATYDRRELKLYVDGDMRASTAYSEPVGRNPFPLSIGDGFIGAVDKVEIFSRALEAAEVRNLFRAAGSYADSMMHSALRDTDRQVALAA